MDDISIHLAHTPGTLASLGEVLGNAGISLEGGGVFVHEGVGVAHFLVEDGAAAVAALQAAGINVIGYTPVLVQRLRQDKPGQLGQLTRRMAEAGVNIEVMYSDHANQLILVVDDMVKGQQVSDKWRLEHTTT
jgi:hypothetical protein